MLNTLKLWHCDSYIGAEKDSMHRKGNTPHQAY